MKVKLPKTVASPQDLSALTLEVKEYAKWYAHEAIKNRFGSHKPSSNTPVLSAGASEIIRSWFGNKEPNRLGFDGLIRTLEQYGKSSQLVTITLAAPAPNSLKATLVEWFRANVSPDVLVSFQINSTLLGGMVVRSGSRVFDWSFRRQIIDGKTAFPEVLRRV